MTAAWAQGLSGALVGTVKDEQGGVLPGALVRVTSPALIGGALTTTTNERGQLRFPVLAPGTYTLTIELPPKFAPYREENITIGAGATLERTVVLAWPASPSGRRRGDSRIEARSSGFETRFGRSTCTDDSHAPLQHVRHDRAAPGVSPTSPSSGTVNTVSAFGSGVNENAFLIDGTNFTCPCQGVSRAEPSVDVIQEVQVQSMGASVEYGNIRAPSSTSSPSRAAIASSTTRRTTRSRPALTSQPVVLPVPGAAAAIERVRAERYRDFTTNLGGPVVRDRLWFFGGYQYLRDYDSQPGADPAFPRTYEQNKVFGKLTWRLTPSLQLMQSFHQEYWVNPTPPTLVTPFEATLRVQRVGAEHDVRPPHAHAVANTVWEVRVGRFVLRPEERPELRRSDDAEPVRSDHRRLERQRAADRRTDARSRHGEGRPQPLSARLARRRPPDRGSARRSSAASIARRPSSPAAFGTSTATASRSRRYLAHPSIEGGRFDTRRSSPATPITLGIASR